MALDLVDMNEHSEHLLVSWGITNSQCWRWEIIRYIYFHLFPPQTVNVGSDKNIIIVISSSHHTLRLHFTSEKSPISVFWQLVVLRAPLHYEVWTANGTAGREKRPIGIPRD